MASDQVKRKLPAILAADIAGHSRLMGADEIGTITDVLLLVRFRHGSCPMLSSKENPSVMQQRESY
jgi:hypothetical protein